MRWNRIAAEEGGLSANSAYQLRKEPGGEDFARAWEEAVALHRKRNPAEPRHARELRQAQARRAGDPPPLEEPEKRELLEGILALYLMKLKAERTARLEGRVVEADLCVRQLAWIEIILAIGGRAQELLEMMKQGDRHLSQIVATPASALLERARRAFWQEKGEADRPPPAPLGNHNEFYATGEGSDYNAARDGDYREWERRQAEKQRLAAEAQAEWEARAHLPRRAARPPG